MKSETKYVQPTNIGNLFHSTYRKGNLENEEKVIKKDGKFENRTFATDFHSVCTFEHLVWFLFGFASHTFPNMLLVYSQHWKHHKNE